MDELRDKFYDLEDFIIELQDLCNTYKNKVDSNYIEQIEATWCEASDELEDLRPIIEKIENEENTELVNQYWREAM